MCIRDRFDYVFQSAPNREEAVKLIKELLKTKVCGVASGKAEFGVSVPTPTKPSPLILNNAVPLEFLKFAQ